MNSIDKSTKTETSISPISDSYYSNTFKKGGEGPMGRWAGGRSKSSFVRSGVESTEP